MEATLLDSRELYLRMAPSRLPRYPPRPASLLPSSPSVDKLREVLGRAPQDADDEGMECEEDYLGDRYYNWGTAYLTQLLMSMALETKAGGVLDGRSMTR
jgi:hypothetical protein